MSNNVASVAPVNVFEFSNEEVADVLDQVADLLESQEANPYRVRAYREAARMIRARQDSVVELLQQDGVPGLEKLPGIGKSLAASLDELIHTGRLRQLDRLVGEASPEDLFITIPGIGEELAHRLHEELGIDTLEELELAAHDGRLEQVKGFGQRRIRLIREALAGMLSRSARRRSRLLRRQNTEGRESQPSAAVILQVDAQYRQQAKEGKLRTIAPRRFNPEGKRWLPIMHLEQGGWTLTAMYSNTARAHELDKLQDWVVIYYERYGYEGQCTVVTETHGPLTGKRVIRGREAECTQAYEQRPEMLSAN